MSILKETGNFFRLYHHCAGTTEVPSIFTFWTCVSLIAAVLEDRVWFEFYKNKPLSPNLYIILVAPGSAGKGIAISQAAKLSESASLLNRYRGRTTYAHLTDCLGKATKDEYGRDVIANPKVWLIMDELLNDIGCNKVMTMEFIAFMTEAFTAGDYTIQTGTRTHGRVDITKPCINWLAGTTDLWLKKVVTRETFESGFIARTCFIGADYAIETRIKPSYPEDCEEVWEHLKQRIWMMQAYRGRFVMTTEAEAEFDRWFFKRPSPLDEQMFSVWKRHIEMILKFAMICCVADGREQVIQHKHLIRATAMVKVVNGFAHKLIDQSNQSWETKPVSELERYIEKKKTLGHVDLLRYARAKKGYNAAKVKEVVEGLEAEKKIEIGMTDKGGKVYTWRG